MAPSDARVAREGRREPFTGEGGSEVLSGVRQVRGADVFRPTEGNTAGVDIARHMPTPRRRRPWHAQKPFAREPGDLHRRSSPGRCREMPFDNHCLTLAICFSAAQLRESRQTPVYARCRDYGRGEGPKAPRNVPPAHQMPGPALCRARTNSREDTRGRGLREPRLAKATCCWRDRQPCYPSHVARATGVRRDPRVPLQPSKSLCWRKRFGDLGIGLSAKYDLVP